MRLYAILVSIFIILGAVPIGFAEENEVVAVIVSTPADAIVAAPYAKALGYKIFYTQKDSLSDTVKMDLERYQVDKVIIVGGPVAVSNEVESQLKKMGVKTKRIYGDTRIETSIAVFNDLIKKRPELTKNIIIAEGFNEKITPVAVSFDSPVLYYGLNRDDKVIEALKEVKVSPENVIILGKKVPNKVVRDIKAKNILIAAGKDDEIIKTALAYAPKINPDIENKKVAVTYAEKSNNPILDAIVSFVKGDVSGVVPIPEKKEDVLKSLISKISTFASGIVISSDTSDVSEIISDIAYKLGITSTTVAEPTRRGGRGITPAPKINEKPEIKEFKIVTDGLKVTFNIKVTDKEGLKKIVLKYGDGTTLTKNISGTEVVENLSKTYILQGKYIVTLEVYDDADQKVSKSEDVNLMYFNVNPEYISKIVSGGVNEVIPITITNYQNTSISLINITTGNLTVSASGDLTIPGHQDKIINYTITNSSALIPGRTYDAKITFALSGHSEINKTVVCEISIPKVETKATTSGKNVSLQVVNTTTVTNTSIEINDSKSNEFEIKTVVGNKSITFAIPTTNTSDTSVVENITINLENINDVLTRADKIKNTSIITEDLIKPILVASKDVKDVSVDIKNISINEDANKLTLHTDISFNDTINNSYVVIAIPVGNNSVDKIVKNGSAIPEYDGSGAQRNYYIYDANNGLVILFMKDDPLLEITLNMGEVNQPPVIVYTELINGLNVLINASESYDPEGKNLTFKWEIPGNETVTYIDNGKVVNITYPVDGTYDITLTVSDGVYEVSSVISVSVAQPVVEKPAITIIANGKTVKFMGQDANTLTIAGAKTINLPTITASVNVVDKKDISKGIEIYFKDNASVKSIIEAMNNFNVIAYSGDTITITYNNPEMNGKNVTMSIINDRNGLRNALRALLNNGDATDLIGIIEKNQYSTYNCTQTVSNDKATWTVPASDFTGYTTVIITEGNGVASDADNVKILAVGGFIACKYNMTLTNTTSGINQTNYTISLSGNPNNKIRYGIMSIDRNVGIELKIEGTNPNDVLFNVSVVGSSGSETVIENSDFITLNASKILDIIEKIFNGTASALYSAPTTSNTTSLEIRDIPNSYTIGIAYDTVDKKIVAIEQQ
ncbi:PKD domain-containing protein [Methanotorris igneus]|uniref:PKD domain containing protein n=1 Tax=Methanotorris igneus (strain DSM 5666 / JCM 11834 / Kol 5) TaxID=880724 RepID=F6BAW4_METIK|nr:PKD domain-containing protein [Methanotorris igneus]AEF97051.1 PKD domain containing protein [Methanotorris igneus Kol 5]